jgi:hypothetical protein
MERGRSKRKAFRKNSPFEGSKGDVKNYFLYPLFIDKELLRQ